MSDREELKRLLIWGWLRWFLGIAQMSLSMAGALVLVAEGMRPLTWILCAGATAAAVISRLLYRGRRAPP